MGGTHSSGASRGAAWAASPAAPRGTGASTRQIAGARAETRGAGRSARRCSSAAGERAASAATSTSESGILLLSGSLWTASSPAWSSAAEEIFLVILVVGVVALGDYNRVRIGFVVIIGIFGTVPEAVAVVLVDCPAAILVFIVVVRPLSPTEPAEVV